MTATLFTTSDPAALAHDPAWWPHRYDEAGDRLQLARLTRADHARVTFLNEEHLAGYPKQVVARAPFASAVPPPAPLHFIFHAAFCLSSVLARACDAPGLAMGLKEPMLLQDVVRVRRQGAPPPRVGQLLDEALRLLARPFAAGEALVVKPSNIVNSLAPAMLALRPEANALLLRAPLRTFLASIAKKGMWGRLWARELLVGLMKDGEMARFGFTVEDHLNHTDLQVAAVGWLAQQAMFGDLVHRFGPARVRMLDSETLLARPREAIAALFALFRLPADPARIDAIVAGPAFTRHSKEGTAFGAAARAEEYRLASLAHADEIDKVAQWAEAVAAAAGLPLEQGAPLLA